MSPLRLSLLFIQILYTCNLNFISTTCSSDSEAKHELVVVKGLNVTRYVGKWYQIAAIPTFFEPKNAKNVRAIYTLNSDGSTVHVVNEELVDGFNVSIQGTLYKANSSSDDAKFKVKFNVVPIPGDYWVLYLDDDYQYALVGDPNRFSLFILSKKMQIDDVCIITLSKERLMEVMMQVSCTKLHRLTHRWFEYNHRFGWLRSNFRTVQANWTYVVINIRYKLRSVISFL